jgi:hypothetical protein
MKFIRIALIVLLAGGVVLGIPRASIRAAADAGDQLCADFSGLSGTYAAFTGSTNVRVGTPSPGDVFKLEFTPGTGTNVTVRMVGNPAGTVTLAGPANIPVAFTYVVPQSGLPAGSVGIGFYFDSGNEGSVNVSASCLMPGCDALMPLSSTAVVGSFVADTPLYYEPGVLIVPTLTMAAGKTAWVIGVDASHQYYEIVWVCDLLWVPLNTMGPNYDAVWQGKPLPQDVVQ